MKEPLEKQLEKAYQIFNKDHEHLRENVMDSIIKPQIEYEPEPEQSFVPKCKSSCPSLGEIIMDSRIFKIAAAIIIVGIVAISLKVFTGTSSISSVAFGDVLKQIRSKSYTFDMKMIRDGQSQGVNKCMMLQPGLARFDAVGLMGGITTISNFVSGESIVIFHGQKTVINMKEYLKIQGIDQQEIGPLDVFLNPVENLWNLHDGTEKPLGEKDIDNQNAVGFEVHQEDENYISDIVVWANSETGVPVRVEVILYNPQNNSESLTMVMDKFNLDVELAPELFSMEPPEGYTMAYQNALDETIQEVESTPEVDKIQQCIELWSDGEEDKAIETLLNVDWSEPFKFSGDMYLFYWKETDFVMLKQEDQQVVVQKILDTSSLLRKMCFKIWEDAQTEISNQKYSEAEQYLTVILELGRLINRDPELTYIAQMVGHAIIKKSLTEMGNLYAETGEQDKWQQIQKDIKEIDTEIESFRN